MYQEQDIPFYQIVDAFLQQYQTESQTISLGLTVDIDKLEEYKAKIATIAPNASRFLEEDSGVELQTKVMILAIAFSVARAIVEANHILH